MTLILLVFAFVFACIAAARTSWTPVGAPRNWGWSFGWGSLAFYFLSLLVPMLTAFAGHR
jgi:uncharacterized membrane protein (DUF485 family)